MIILDTKYLESDSNIMIENEIQNENIFWCYILYIVGSHIIDNINKQYLKSDDVITRLFYGYWILNNIE